MRSVFKYLKLLQIEDSSLIEILNWLLNLTQESNDRLSAALPERFWDNTIGRWYNRLFV